jgi:outer membrane lipopolysaccharide assembly protein LptE/RlpB
MANEGVLKVMKADRKVANVKADAFHFRMLNESVDKETLSILVEAYQAEVSLMVRLDLMIYQAECDIAMEASK